MKHRMRFDAVAFSLWLKTAATEAVFLNLSKFAFLGPFPGS